MWEAQVSSMLRGAQLDGYILPTAAPPSAFIEPADVDPATGKKGEPFSNPEYTKWVAQDQQILSYLIGSLSKEIFSQVSIARTAAKLWAAIQAQHASLSRARVISTRMALATTTKGSSTVAEYITKMKGLADEMAPAGRKIDDDELVSYILTGLGEDFDGPVSAISARVEPITVAECYAQLVSHEQRKELHGGGSHSSVNVATRGNKGGNGNFNHHGGSGRNDGGHGGFTRRGGNGGRSRGKNFLAGMICQIYGKESHMAYRCFKRFNERFTGSPPQQQKSALTATTSSYGVDTNWYIDSGATDHITSDLDKLTGVIGITATTTSMLQTVLVWRFLMLVTLPCVPHIIQFIFVTFFMFPAPIKIYYLSIV